jgi:hypothetical protein
MTHVQYLAELYVYFNVWFIIKKKELVKHVERSDRMHCLQLRKRGNCQPTYRVLSKRSRLHIPRLGLCRCLHR